MKLSTKGRYGLRAMVDLACNCVKEPVSISSISERQNISISYLEQLIAKLKKAGLVNSIRGSQGGYVLAKSPDCISVGEVLRALEGDLTPVECGEVTGKSNCDNSDCCVTKIVWQRINDSINQAVDAIYISQLIEDAEKLKNDNKKNNCGV